MIQLFLGQRESNGSKEILDDIWEMIVGAARICTPCTAAFGFFLILNFGTENFIRQAMKILFALVFDAILNYANSQYR